MTLSHQEKPVGEEREEKKRRKTEENKGWMTQGFQWFVLLGVQQSMTPCSRCALSSGQGPSSSTISNSLVIY